MIKEAAANSKNTFSIGDLRDVLIIGGGFFFFTGWIYIYYFYDYFGISLSLISIDYATFIVYSFVVMISYDYLPLVGLIALVLIYKSWLKKYITLSILVALLLFPGLFLLAKGVAHEKAVALRNSPNSMRQISFVFKDDAGFLAYRFDRDSLPGRNLFVQTDLTILKNTDIPGQLYLLGQNSDYFFVLSQPPPSPGIKELPFGSIYFINKNTVLYSRITITSNQNK